MTTTTTAKPRRGRASVPEVAAPASSSSALDALTAQPTAGGDSHAVLVPLERLRPHPHNPRKNLGDLTELTTSIRAHGVRQNLLVVPDPDDRDAFRIVIGHRRAAASRDAGLTAVPVVVDHGLDEISQRELMLVENLQRVDLTPVEEADGYQDLLDLGVDVATIAAHTGRSETTVRSRLRLAALPGKARDAIHARDITLEDAAALSALPPDRQEPVLKAIGTPNFAYEVRKAREAVALEEEVAPLLKVLADAGATELPKNEWQSPEGAVVHLRAHASRATGAAEDLAGKVDAGWTWRWYWGEIIVYRPFTLEEAQEQAEAAERRATVDAEWKEAQARAAQARAVRTEFATVTAATRREFLEHLIHDRKALTKDQTAALLDYVATAAAEHPWDGTYHKGAFRGYPFPTETSDADAFVDWLRIKLPDDYRPSYHRDELLPIVAAAAADLSAPQRLLAALAAAVEPIGEDTWRYGGRSVTTARWYALLEQLGYVVSDAERAALVVPLDDDEDADESGEDD
ncbi:ParB/RepB/Spo0J family partition protein [Cellulomonas palmilytica]|uniref:ParB/RepB/Spo0J family partition protein n=1 Tax=Cellulomonas palmilytica TaxID=2608402 RepID=UPI001F278497|nr:ParB/RepB/Spo0J family partition protein [Cellulomonas palmilytica]UJP39354.1 ParB/RepB/Spo0J family partition protein [Cellulomonas palmilytica]